MTPFAPLLSIAAPTFLTLLQTNQNRTPAWVILFIVMSMLLLLWWGLTRNDIPEEGAADTHADESVDAGETAVSPPPPPAKPDNLKQVEGIGPKIEGVLHAAGILTFAQLAATEVRQLEKIVREDAGIRVAYPDTWPEQAQLAADGAWDALEKLQDALKGGRRV